MFEGLENVSKLEVERLQVSAGEIGESEAVIQFESVTFPAYVIDSIELRKRTFQVQRETYLLYHH